MSGVNRDPMTAAAFSARLAAGSRRSMRAAITACKRAGHVDVADRIGAQIAAAAAHQYVALAEDPERSPSAKKGFPAARSAMSSASSATDLSSPRSSAPNASICESSSGSSASSVSGAHEQAHRRIRADM